MQAVGITAEVGREDLIDQTLHDRETGGIDVTEVLILVSSQNLPGPLLIFDADSDDLG
jgi:hypothetical protein